MTQRIIKFRAWDKEHKKIVDDIYNHTFYNSLNDCLKNSELMQFTGLLDKNGKEIYEGDIVKTPLKRNQEVVYIAPDFCLRSNPQDNIDIDSFSTPMVFEEIIGNIYENPNLLK